MGRAYLRICRSFTGVDFDRYVKILCFVVSPRQGCIGVFPDEAILSANAVPDAVLVFGPVERRGWFWEAKLSVEWVTEGRRHVFGAKRFGGRWEEELGVEGSVFSERVVGVSGWARTSVSRNSCSVDLTVWVREF